MYSKTEAEPTATSSPVGSVKSASKHYIALTKPGLSSMTVATAMFGYFVSNGPHSMGTLVPVLLGTGLAAGGAAALNQVMESAEDGLMERTADRPIPSGKLQRLPALIFGAALALGGLALLYFLVGKAPFGYTLATLIIYLAIYTPLKKVHWISTYVGALPGAIPPLIGASAVQNPVGLSGWLLFAVLFAWQIPHFMAISWLYKQDYIRGNFAMLSRDDASGKAVSLHAVLFAGILLLICLIPIFLGQAHWIYAALAPLLAGWLLYGSLLFYKNPTHTPQVRRLFFSTLLFLPFYMFVFLLGIIS